MLPQATAHKNTKLTFHGVLILYGIFYVTYGLSGKKCLSKHKILIERPDIVNW
jgi:hypothetical protein